MRRRKRRRSQFILAGVGGLYPRPGPGEAPTQGAFPTSPFTPSQPQGRGQNFSVLGPQRVPKSTGLGCGARI